MESKDEEDSGGQAQKASSIEELRIKRLAYFSSPERGLNPAANNPKLTKSASNGQCSSQSKNEFREARPYGDNSSDRSEGSQHDLPYFLSSQNGNRETLLPSSLEYDENVNMEPKISHKTPFQSSNRYQKDRERRSVTDSQDYDPISVFQSHGSFSELGLSTHRPESVSGGNRFGAEMEGSVFVPSPNGPGKMAKDIFGDKASEQMRNALGDQGFDDLLSKVNKNLNHHREQSRSGQNNVFANHLAGDGPSLDNQRSGESNQLAGGPNSFENNSQLWKEGEKKVHTLSRNYDQVTVPKNTRNSFSADEIYQQAFGSYQDPSVYIEREQYNGRFNSSLHQPSWNGQFQHSHPMDFHNASKRRFSYDGTPETVQRSSPRSQLHMAPLACPPMHMPPPGYNSTRVGPPMSPHSAGPPSTPFAFQGMGHQGYIYHNQFRTPYHSQYHMHADQSQYGHPSYPGFMPSSPSAMSQSSNGFHYPPPAYSSGQYSVPRFPHGVPLHLPPPPIPPQLKQSAGQQNYFTPSAGARRNSLSLQGTEEGIKIPHPPPAPPALKLKDSEAETHPSLEHRRISGGSGFYPHVPPRHSSNPHHYSWEGEGPVNHYNLQRYFSSMEIHRQGSSADTNHSGAPLLSSRSVEGDFYRAAEKKSSSEGIGNFVSDGGDNDGDNEDAASCSSGFTSVTATTMNTGKAGGLTRRLENLGVDLEHLRHLRVVDRKQHDQEASDANFEKLSKGIRYCPECSTPNKAYMDWCLGCGEILIGVEPSLPGQRSKQADGSSANFNSNGGTDKKPIRGSTKASKGSNGGNEQVSGRDSLGRSSRLKSRNVSNSRSVKKTETYMAQESPESGKGLSLSSSPVRYRREQEEAYEDPKDSGRASSNEAQERFRTLPREDQRESGEEDSYSGDDLEVMDEEDFVEEEGVEYDYQDSEPNFFEQIKDPVLRDFIISYRNKQIMKEDEPRTYDSGKPEDVINSNYQVDNKSALVRDKSEVYDESVKESMAVISKLTGTLTSQFNIELPPDSKKALVPGATEHSSYAEDRPQHFENTYEGSENRSNATAFDAEEKRAKKKEDRKKKKPKKKKVAPMDVEIFGYEEIRQSRDSSRASNTHSIPLLNLTGSSDEEGTSDEDDSDSQDDDSSSQDERMEPKEKSQVNSLSENPMHHNKHHHSSHDGGLRHVYKTKPVETSKSQAFPKPRPSSASASASSKKLPAQKQSQAQSASYRGDASANRGKVFHASREGRQGETSGYQRHWARSSTAWSSYHPRELSTRSSLNVTALERNNIRTFKKGERAEVSYDSSAREGQGRSSLNGFHPGDEEGTRSRPSSGSSLSSNGGNSGIPVRQRPSSAEYSRRVPTEPHQRPSSAQVRPSKAYPGRSRPSSQNTPDQVTPPRQPQLKVNNYMASPNPRNGSVRPIDRQESNEQSQAEDSTASPRLLCPEPHRLPHTGLDEEHADKLHAIAKNSYDKLQQMTPRISGGEVSIWQCLPDELWLYVFEFVTHGDLCRLMRSCHYFYRLANDETLWKYITVRSKLAMNDIHLATIAQHCPLSLAMVMCNGRDLSQDSLHSFFGETQGRLKELNICGCSHGSLGGALVLETAAQYCSGLTHLDASYCNLTNAALEAIALCVDRLESLCVNGFQSMSDSCLLTVLKKHGKSLRTLELYACFSLSASSLRGLGEHCTSLKKLCLGSCNKLTDSAMVTLSAHLGRIEELDLRGCKNLKNDCIRKIVRNCPRLNRLVLANCPHISDLSLTEIATHLKTTLRTLELCGCNNVTDQGLTTLAKNCDRLVNVDISSTKCSSNSVYQLSSNSCSRWLETVKLSFLTPLTEASVVSLIRQCPRLKVVHVFGCTSLRNLAKLRQFNMKLSLEGDENFTWFSHGAVDS